MKVKCQVVAAVVMEVVQMDVGVMVVVMRRKARDETRQHWRGIYSAAACFS